MTSLHDTTISDLNNGFKEASCHFKKLMEDTKHILEASSNTHNIEVILKMLKDTAAIMENVMEILVDDSLTVTGLAVAGAIIFLIILQAAVIIKLNRDIKINVMEMNAKIQEIEKQKDQGDKLERIIENLDKDLRNTVIHAVNQAVEVSVGNAVGRTLVRTQCPEIEQPDTTITWVQTGTRYLGNTV